MTGKTAWLSPAQSALKGGIRHGFSGALYTIEGPDRVRVTMPSGAFGLFDGIGRWVEGEVYDVDPEMCIWLSSKRASVSHRLSPQGRDSVSDE